jgi:glutamate carboxypeptidase
VRALANEDLDLLEKQLRESVQNKLIPDTQVELVFRRGRPAFVANAASRALAAQAAKIYEEIGMQLVIREAGAGRIGW